jgi:hypothetical protein
VAARALLQALVPGLHRLARTVGGGSDEAAAELVALAWARIVTYPFERRPGRVAANVLLDVRKTYLREHRGGAVIIDEATARRRLVRHEGVLVEARGAQAEEVDVVDARDALRRLLAGAELRPVTLAYLWGRACGEDNATLRARLGLTRAQTWDCWRRGLAALARAS